MMLGKHHAVARIRIVEIIPEYLCHVRLLEELSLDPARHGDRKCLATARRAGQVGLDQAFKLEQRFLEIGDVLHVAEFDARFVETIARRI